MSYADKIAAMRDKVKKGVLEVPASTEAFCTPPSLVAHMADLLEICTGDSLLDPSCGTGNLLAAVLAFALPGHLGAIHGVELNHRLVLAAQERFIRTQARIMEGDFLEIAKNRSGLRDCYDRIIMNPPFGRGADIAHIRAAAGLLAPGGRLVALCAAGPRQRDAFAGQDWRAVGQGAFKSAGTMVNVAILVIDKPD